MQSHRFQVPSSPVAIVVRPQPGPEPGGGDPQTLLFVRSGIIVLDISDPDSGAPLRLGPRLEAVDVLTGHPYEFTHTIWCAAYDPSTDAVYFFEGHALMRLDRGNGISLVAGSKARAGSRDGNGPRARFYSPYKICTDSAGSLFIEQGDRSPGIRRVSAHSGRVATIPCFVVNREEKWSLDYWARSRQLIVATETALYGMRPDGATTLITGRDGYHVSLDGSAARALFRSIRGLVVPPGSDWAYLVDHGALRRVDLRTGDTATLTTMEPGGINSDTQLALLPNAGGLVVTAPCTNRLYLVTDGQLRTAWSTSGGGPSTSTAASCSAVVALPSLLQQSDNGSAVVAVRTGERAFIAHRAVLSECSEYFRGLLEGGFRESGSAEVELPGADPDCFGHLLGYMYTGVLSDVPEEQLRPMLELAGRLMLGEVLGELNRRLLAVCTPASLLADLVWAERHGLQGLVEPLKARARREFRQVAEATPPELLGQLMRDHTELMTDVVRGFVLGPGGT